MATDVFTVRWAVTGSKHLYSLSEDRVVCYVEGQVAGEKELCNLLIKISGHYLVSAVAEAGHVGLSSFLS